MGQVKPLPTRFPISGCTFSSPLGWRRWQKCYCFCPGNGNVHHCCPQSTNSRAWGLRSACVHHGQHDGCCSSCCLSKSKTKNESKSAKEILNEIDSFFLTNCWRTTKRTGHYAWPHSSFSWSDCACNHPSCHRTWCSLSPCCHVKGNCGIYCLNGNDQVGNCSNPVGCFDGNCGICGNDAAGSSTHGYAQQEDETFSFPLAASHPWQSSRECKMTCWLPDTAWRWQWAWSGQ